MTKTTPEAMRQVTVDRDETAVVRHRYDRIAPFYDAMEWVVETPRGFRSTTTPSIPPKRIEARAPGAQERPPEAADHIRVSTLPQSEGQP